MRFLNLLSTIFAIAVALIALSPAAQSKEKKKNSPVKDPQDAIEVVGHIPPADGPVTRFFTTQHYSRSYLYVEHEDGKNVTLVDVSDPAQPSVLAEIPSTAKGGSTSLLAVTGTAALVTDYGANESASVPQTMRVMDFSDPRHPKVAREFSGVTAISRDDRRGLIFLADPDGIWILHQSFAEDPQAEKDFEHRLLYDR